MCCDHFFQYNAHLACALPKLGNFWLISFVPNFCSFFPILTTASTLCHHGKEGNCIAFHIKYISLAIRISSERTIERKIDEKIAQMCEWTNI